MPHHRIGGLSVVDGLGFTFRIIFGVDDFDVKGEFFNHGGAQWQEDDVEEELGLWELFWLLVPQVDEMGKDDESCYDNTNAESNREENHQVLVMFEAPVVWWNYDWFRGLVEFDGLNVENFVGKIEHHDEAEATDALEHPNSGGI